MRAKSLLYPLTVALALSCAVVATPTVGAQAVPCGGCAYIFVSPHGGSAGTWRAAGGPVTLTWTVYNDWTAAQTVTLTPSASKCAVVASPPVVPTSVTLAPGETRTVYTNVQAGCVGSGFAYLKAGFDQGSQSITFT